MITALVQFKLPHPMTVTQARTLFESTAQKYLDLGGLIRKYYILSPDGGTAGGIYLWRTQADAERLYTADWRHFVRSKYGAEPIITYFVTPVVVDNLAGQVVAHD